MSMQTEIAAISRTIVEQCRKLAELDQDDVLRWRQRDVSTRENSTQVDLPLADVQHCQFELALFYFVIFTHLISTLSPLPDNVRQQILEETRELFEQWARKAFSEHLARVKAGVPRHVNWRLREYDRPTVVNAVAGPNLKAQEILCQKLYANTKVNPGEDEAWDFRFACFCQVSGLPGNAIRIFDAVYSKLGPNSRLRSIYDRDRTARTVELSSVPRMDLSQQSVLPLPGPIATQLRSHLSLDKLIVAASSIFAVGAMAALAVATTGLVLFTAHLDIVRLAASLLVVPAVTWLVRWAIRHRAASLAALSVQRNGRYVLYLRQSDIDRAPPSIDFEAGLATTFAPIAPFLGIARSSLVRPSGMVCIKEQSDWELAVTQLIRGAELTLLVVGPRRGYDQAWDVVDEAWKETESITHLAKPGRVLFLFPRQTGDYPVLLLHPKGDRVYGVSTLLHEVRRLIDPEFTGNWPERMGRDSWLWWTPDGRFLPLPTSGKDTFGSLWGEPQPGFAPLIQNFGRAHGRDWWVMGLGGAGIVLGLIVMLFGSSLLGEMAGNWGFVAGAALATLLVLYDFRRSLSRRSRWLAYNNTVRPRSKHPFGLQGTPPGRRHDDLPY